MVAFYTYPLEIIKFWTVAKKVRNLVLKVKKYGGVLSSCCLKDVAKWERVGEHWVIKNFLSRTAAQSLGPRLSLSLLFLVIGIELKFSFAHDPIEFSSFLFPSLILLYGDYCPSKNRVVSEELFGWSSHV